MKKFLVLFLLICSMVSAQPATPKYGQNIPPGGVLGFYPGDSKFYSLPVNASGALLVDSGEAPLWELNASGVVETLDDRAIDALSLQLSSDGTAAAPAISFGSDPDTGIYRYGANSIGLSGTLLVNTATPTANIPLNVAGSNNTVATFFGGADQRGVGIGGRAGAASLQSFTAAFGGSPLSLNPDGGAVLIGMAIDDGATKLQVNGSMRLAGGAAPGAPSEGSIYFNSTDKHFYGYNGTAWVQLDN